MKDEMITSILPQRFCERMKELLDGEYEDFLNSYSTEIHKGIRINTLKCPDVEAMAAEIGAVKSVEWCREGYYIDKENINGSHPYHAAGLVYFQEPSAMCAAQGLPLTDNARILDLCAAPGGKTTQIAARMKNKGLLISNEIISKRAAILAENVERMGLTNTIVTNESPAALAERFPCFFDGIIVDAPCSGEGMFRKEPQAIREWSEAHTLSCAERQKNILDDAYKMLRAGGYIMYSTCTFSYDENEAVVGYMVDKYGMEVCEIPDLAMLSEGKGDFPGVEKCRRILPHKHDGEGHFAALLRKTEMAEVASAKSEKRNKKQRRDTVLEDAIKAWRVFEKESLNIECDGEFLMFGDNLYMIPQKLDTNKLRIMRCGLHLGTVRKGRFIPAHALSHAFEISAYKNFVDLDVFDEDLKKYMRGEVIPGDRNGWCVISVRGCGIGWGKASGGMIKNHYPKGLRLL